MESQTQIQQLSILTLWFSHQLADQGQLQKHLPSCVLESCYSDSMFLWTGLVQSSDCHFRSSPTWKTGSAIQSLIHPRTSQIAHTNKRIRDCLFLKIPFIITYTHFFLIKIQCSAKMYIHILNSKSYSGGQQWLKLHGAHYINRLAIQEANRPICRYYIQ
jgi:hypothetical protein